MCLQGDDTLWVTATRGNCVHRVSLKTGKVVETVDVGVAPFTVVCAGEDRCYVSNWGGDPPKAGDPQAKSSGTPLRIDPRTGVANHGSVSVLEQVKGQWRQVRTIPVGLHPCALLASRGGRLLYVANANSDTVSVLENDQNWSGVPLPGVSIGNAAVTEGGDGTVNATFTVTLSRASSVDVTVYYETADGTATAGSDFVATSGEVIIPAGQAMGRLADEIARGTVPGLSDIREVFADDIHPNDRGFYLVAMVTHAALTGRDPRGCVASCRRESPGGNWFDLGFAHDRVEPGRSVSWPDRPAGFRRRHSFWFRVGASRGQFPIQSSRTRSGRSCAHPGFAARIRANVPRLDLRPLRDRAAERHHRRPVRVGGAVAHRRIHDPRHRAPPGGSHRGEGVGWRPGRPVGTAPG